MAEKPHLNMVFIGHVDHGKSTTIGRILFDSGIIEEQALRKLKEKAKELGKVGFEFAYVMDSIKEEQERGLTISLAYKKFETKKFAFTVIDAPGHKDFIKNMITGTSQADAAVVVVSGVDSVQEQTREHIFLAKTLGIKQLIVAINKMDLANYSEDKYKAAVMDVDNLLKTVGFNPDATPKIPIASLKGDNITKKSENMAWYKGKPLVDSFDDLKPIEKPTNLPLRMPVQDVYTITGIGTVPVGRIETGIMKVGQKLVFMPSGKTGELKSIEMHHETMAKAEPGDNVGINIRGLGKQDARRGDVIGEASSPPMVASKFTARILILDHPSVVTVGYSPVFHCHTAQVSARILEIKKKMDPRTGQVVAESPDFLKTGDYAEVVVEPLQPLCIEKQSDFPQLSKFAIRDMGKTVAAGMCVDVVKKEIKIA
jgi:elongation factor 1-alpha